MVANFIEDQHVARRRPSARGTGSRLSHKLTYQSAFFDGDFMSQFRQKPAHAKHHRPARPGIRKPLFSFSIFKKSFPRKSAGFATENAAAFEGQRVSRRPETRKSAGFSFPIPSLMTLAVIAGTLVISLIALNWEGLPLESPRSYALQPAADAEGQRNLASYAGVPSFGLPETVAVTPEAEPASETVAGATPEKVSDTPEASKTVSVTDPIPLDLM
jgi:hypothetical protein